MDSSDSSMRFGRHFTFAAYRRTLRRALARRRIEASQGHRVDFPTALSLNTPHTSRMPVHRRSSGIPMSLSRPHAVLLAQRLTLPGELTQCARPPRVRFRYGSVVCLGTLRIPPRGGHPVPRLLDATDTPRPDFNQQADTAAWRTWFGTSSSRTNDPGTSRPKAFPDWPIWFDGAHRSGFSCPLDL